MELDLYQINAFSQEPFGGNPAAVVFLEQWLPETTMQRIAQENALAETAFLVAENDHFHIRWFTPEIEMDLCGHATLAAAYALVRYRGYQHHIVRFSSASGDLNVLIKDNLFTLDFPSRPPMELELPETIGGGFNLKPLLTLKSRDYILVFDREEDIRKINVDPDILNQINIDPGAIVITAPGDQVDFVSRVFTPQASIFEDPATGSTHCSLIPWWSNKLGKSKLTALQLSDRQGYFECEDLGLRVMISGQCHPYLAAKIYI